MRCFVMRKIKRSLTLLLAIFVFLSMTNIVTLDIVSAASMSFTENSFNVKGGDVWKIYLTSNSSDANTWSSSNENAVNIYGSNTRSATLEAVGAGTSIITVEDIDGNKATCTVKVTVDPFKLSATSLKVGVENEIELIAYNNDNITWTSSNSDIVEIYWTDSTKYDDDYNIIGASASLRGNGFGSATITATNQYGAKASCVVNVVDSYIELDKQSVTIDVRVDDKSTVEVTTGSIRSITSSNESVAIGEQDGNDVSITAKGIGTAIITVTDEQGATANVNVNVIGKLTPNKTKINIDSNYSYQYIFPYSVEENSTRITNVVSNNESIATVEELSDEGWKVKPVSNGTTTLTCYDDYGNTATINVSVDIEEDDYSSDDYVDYEETPTLKNSSTVNAIKYGSKTIKGKTYAKASVTAKIAGKKYKAKAKKSGKYTIKIPVKKIGTKVKVTFKKGKEKCTFTKKIVKPGVKIKTPSYVYRKTKKMKIKLTNVHKGDIVYVKVGKKTYKKKIKKDKKSYSYKVNLPKRKKAGSKIKITVKNKFKQTLSSKKMKIYYASKLKKGMTKKQCKLVPGWEYPDDVYVYGSTTTWWYDDNGDGYAIDSYLTFYKGKLTGWHW